MVGLITWLMPKAQEVPSEAVNTQGDRPVPEAATKQEDKGEQGHEEGEQNAQINHGLWGAGGNSETIRWGEGTWDF